MNELPELLQILSPAGEGQLALSLVFDGHFRLSFKLDEEDRLGCLQRAK